MTFVLFSVIGVLAVSSPAASPTCAETLLADWYDDAIIGGLYEPDCYTGALDALPEDVRVYTTAADDISRALRAELTAGEATAGEAAPAAAGTSRSLSGLRKPSVSGDENAAEQSASGALGVDGATSSRSLPVPLLLVVALTLVLALGASSGGIARRARRRR